MKTELNDVKSMLLELLQRSGNFDHHPMTPQTPTLLPSIIHKPAPATEFIETQEVTDEPAAKPISKDQVLREAILEALRRNGGRRKLAAQELFMSERTLYRKIKDLNINDNEY
jgi:DNA-binding NtrC family response regulator